MLAETIRLCAASDIPYIPCAREEECIGVACGAAMCGERAVVLVQNAGLLNSLGAFATMALRYQLPFVVITTNRGVLADPNSYDIEKYMAFEASVKTLTPVFSYPANERCRPILCLPRSNGPRPRGGPAVIALEKVVVSRSKRDARQSSLTEGRHRISAGALRDAALHGRRHRLAVGLAQGGSHDARNLYVSGPMGLASSVALGVAASRPKEQVLAVCGDGALAMNLSSLVTIQGARTANLAVLVVANGIYEYTGSLPVPTRDLDWLALGRGIFGAEGCFRLEDLTPEKWKSVKRPAMIVADIAPSTEKTPGLGMTPMDIRASFLAASKV